MKNNSINITLLSNKTTIDIHEPKVDYVVNSQTVTLTNEDQGKLNVLTFDFKALKVAPKEHVSILEITIPKGTVDATVLADVTVSGEAVLTVTSGKVVRSQKTTVKSTKNIKTMVIETDVPDVSGKIIIEFDNTGNSFATINTVIVILETDKEPLLSEAEEETIWFNQHVKN